MNAHIHVWARGRGWALTGFLFVAAIAASGTAHAQPPRGTVVTDTLWSQALGARKELVVYLPPSYATNPARRYPVAYYLHGLDGDESNWTRLGQLHLVMDSLVAAGAPEMIVAMPDGDNSWYATYNVLVDAAGCRRLLRQGGNAERDCVAWPHYDDYIAFDVVRHMDAKYRTGARREARGIAGLSMGGYGAVTLALQYPGTFAAAASHSGTLSPLEWAPAPFGRRPFTRAPSDSVTMARFAAGLMPLFRAVFGADSASWRARVPASIAARLVERGAKLPALFADGGTADVFLPQSRAFVEAMHARAVPIEYHEWSGTHGWVYWRAHVGESLAWIGRQIGAPAGR